MTSDDPTALADTQPDASPAPRTRPHNTDRLFLRQLPFYARHGVYDAERELGQRFIIDVDCWLDTRPAAWA
ncbi:MAG: dihydroneopterin aldolase, partial [Rhizobiales bacterium]|nr:dihydroneopterin aldolase [Hyphomicrobiales bacterium]